MSRMTFCISTYNNNNYLQLAIKSVRENSYFKDAPFVIHAENCTDGTNEWLEENKEKYNLDVYIEPDNNELKIQDAIQIINLRAEGKSEKADKFLINKQKKYLKGK